MLLVKREESRDFDVCFVSGRDEKSLEIIQVESKNPENSSPLWFEGCLELFIAPMCFSRWQPYKGRWRLFKDRGPQKAFDRVDFDTLENILIFGF